MPGACSGRLASILATAIAAASAADTFSGSPGMENFPGNSAAKSASLTNSTTPPGWVYVVLPVLESSFRRPVFVTPSIVAARARRAPSGTSVSAIGLAPPLVVVLPHVPVGVLDLLRPHHRLNGRHVLFAQELPERARPLVLLEHEGQEHRKPLLGAHAAPHVRPSHHLLKRHRPRIEVVDRLVERILWIPRDVPF